MARSPWHGFLPLDGCLELFFTDRYEFLDQFVRECQKERQVVSSITARRLGCLFQRPPPIDSCTLYPQQLGIIPKLDKESPSGSPYLHCFFQSLKRQEWIRMIFLIRRVLVDSVQDSHKIVNPIGAIIIVFFSISSLPFLPIALTLSSSILTRHLLELEVMSDSILHTYERALLAGQSKKQKE